MPVRANSLEMRELNGEEKAGIAISAIFDIIKGTHTNVRKLREIERIINQE